MSVDCLWPFFSATLVRTLFFIVRHRATVTLPSAAPLSPPACLSQLLEGNPSVPYHG